MLMVSSPSYLFLSTPSARRATVFQVGGGDRVHISIHALREEGDIQHIHQDDGRHVISIHALREEGDRDGGSGVLGNTTISIHALREEGDSEGNDLMSNNTEFLSTPSARRATY